MKRPNPKTGLLLDQAVDLMFEIHLLRGDCCSAARTFTGRSPAEESALEECARLEESLARVYRSLQHSLRSIQRMRARPRPTE